MNNVIELYIFLLLDGLKNPSSNKKIYNSITNI